jgi:hypothetical protein
MGYYGRICFCPMGLCGKFGYAGRATEADLVIRYGPLRGMKQYSENLYRFQCCGPSCRICLCALSHNAVFGYALWAVGQDLVMRYGPQRQISYQSIEVQNSFQKLANSFNGTVMLKSACM